MLNIFHVSFALILGLKDEPYDEGIIVINIVLQVSLVTQMNE